MKKFLSFLLCILITASFAACDFAGKTVDTSVKSGELKAVGDVFSLPEIKQQAGAPVLAQVNKQVYPGDSVMIAGEGFKSEGLKFYVYSQTTKDNGRAAQAKFTVVDDNYVSVLIDKKLEYGVYAVYAENAAGTSNIKVINKPAIWELGLTKLCAGETLTVLGENLTTDNKNETRAFLVSGDGKQYCETQICFADPGKVELVIPEGLKVGGKYKVRIHNGHGGKLGFAESKDTVEYLAETAIKFSGKVINVKDYGADPSSRFNDDTKAVKKAVEAAEDGDTVYFPSGAYLITSLVEIKKAIKLEGENAEDTTIYSGYNVEDCTFRIAADPCEVTGLCFEQKRTNGPCKSGFIEFKADSFDTGAYKLYVHDNIFNQTVSKKSRSFKIPIRVISGCGIRVEENSFDSFGLLDASGKKIFLKNNEAQINMYVGVYYGTWCCLFSNVNFLDVSGNTISGKGANGEKNTELKINEYTAGRVFVIQGTAYNTYVSHNKVLRSGIPNYNAGEIILYENLYYQFDGMALSGTGDTVTLAKSNRNGVTPGSVLSVNAGKGRGQCRTVKMRSGDLITLNEPFDIIPDETSHITVNHAYFNAFVCDNELDGYSNWQKSPGSTMGIQVYGSMHNMFFCRNQMENMSYGINITPYYHKIENNDNARAVIAWNQIDDNSFKNIGIGLYFTQTVSVSNDPNPCEMAFGNVCRGNSFSKMLDYTNENWKGKGGVALHIGTGGITTPDYWKGNWMVANLFENSTFKNCERNILFFKRQGNNILRNNTENGKLSDYEVVEGYNGPIVADY